ncbi:hypothetical protein [Nostoc sphaeroides]|uniref:hypothetical protein n=1 Tax=Nostoc sphaeroides TaxID=446679 RepID=UPI0015F316EC|nr:hypothetical protein [Nostoc sphaeroides]
MSYELKMLRIITFVQTRLIAFCTDAINRVSTPNSCTDAINRVSTPNYFLLGPTSH